MNIIPLLKITSPDYWCTWETQYGLARQLFGSDTAEESLAYGLVDRILEHTPAQKK